GDKTNVELEALADGVLAEILVQPGTTVPVGTVLGRIGSSVTTSAPAAAPAAVVAPVEAASSEKVQASPVARRLAQELGIELTGIIGSGPGGRVTREDVEAAAVQRVSTNGSANGKALAAPAVRKLARDSNVNLSAIHGTGTGGRVTRADVEAYLSAAKPVPVVVQPVTPAQPVPTAAVYGDERTPVSLSNMRK